jgi:ABC-type uncharacterized transport system involved in gliding motility auxiliary subunit
VLHKLDRTVTLKFYFNRSAQEVPIPLKTFARQVEDLLREYQLAGGGRIVVEPTHDPKPDSDDEDWAQRFGIAGQPLGLSGVNLYLGLVAVCGDQQAAIPFIDPRNEQSLEYNITRLIYRLGQRKRPVVGVLSSLSVLGTPPMPFMMPGQRPESQPPWVAFQTLKEDYDVREVSPSAESIDADLDALIVVHPKDLPDRMLYALDQFVLRGGRLIAFLDPFCVMDNQADPSAGQFGMPTRASNLQRLLAAWDVSYNPSKLAADQDAATYLRGRGNQVEQSYVYLSLRPANLSRKDVLTASLETMVMPLAGSLSCVSTDKVKVTPLLTTSEKAQESDAMLAQFDSAAIRRGFKSGLKPLTLALRLQGTLSTAFPEGAPGAGDTNAPASAESTLKESATPSTVVLVADVDLLHDQFTVEQMPAFFGMNMSQPANDNISFLLNTVEQMAGSADLIGIRSRGTTARPFQRVLALERLAQEQWLEQERSIEEKLQATQQRLSELESQKDEKQRFIMSPEQQKEIERFREDTRKYRLQLRDVRRSLREGIERLGVRVKLVNILLMPALVVAAGVGFALVRRSRSVR